MNAAGHQPGHDPQEEGGLHRLIADAHASRPTIDCTARHLWAIDRESQRLRRHRRRHRLVSAMASLLLLVGGVGTVAGSATALPGDPLYPVKESLERTELAVAVTDAASARAHLRHARQRLAELEAVADQAPGAVPELAERLFSALDQAERAGGEQVASEVVALRTSGLMLIDRVAAEFDPLVADTTTGTQGAGDDPVPSRDSSADPPSAATRATGGGESARASDADPPSAQPQDPMPAPPPESSVARAGPEDDDEDDGESQAAPVTDPAGETDTAERAEDPDSPEVETGTVQTATVQVPVESTEATPEDDVSDGE